MATECNASYLDFPMVGLRQVLRLRAYLHQTAKDPKSFYS